MIDKLLKIEESEEEKQLYKQIDELRQKLNNARYINIEKQKYKYKKLIGKYFIKFSDEEGNNYIEYIKVLNVDKYNKFTVLIFGGDFGCVDTSKFNIYLDSYFDVDNFYNLEPTTKEKFESARKHVKLLFINEKKLHSKEFRKIWK